MKRLSRIDREALERAIELKRARSSADRQQVDEQLKTCSWVAVGLSAVYDFQMLLVRPRLWQPIPMDVPLDEIETIIAKGDDGKAGNYAAAKLLRRMLRAGLSRYEPEPLKKLAEAKAQRRAASSPPEQPAA